MRKLESALKRLAEGCFVCEANYPDEFEVLSEAEGRAAAQAWLEQIGFRLARLSEDGAFFMAHNVATIEMRAQFREELKNVRGKLEPVVSILESIRQAQGRNPQIHAGDMIWESELSEAVRQSTILERRVMDMRDISGARVGESSNERVRRMLVQMEAEGYVVETNPTSKGYKVTGKIDYLYQLIEFISANTPHLSDDDVVDSTEEAGAQMRIEAVEPDAAMAEPDSAGDVGAGAAYEQPSPASGLDSQNTQSEPPSDGVATGESAARDRSE